MKEKGIHEGTIEQMQRLLQTDCINENGEVLLDDKGRIRIDDWEMREDVQKEVAALWETISTENFRRN